MAIGDAVRPLPEVEGRIGGAPGDGFADRVEDLKRRREQLLAARPWSSTDIRAKQDWNAWAERLSDELRAEEGEELIDLATIAFGEVGRFEEVADFSGMVFPGKVSFENVVFSAGANFDRARFMGPASFGIGAANGVAVSSPAQFYQKTSFSKAVFDREARFCGVVFNAAAAFDGSHFYERADFSNARFRRSCSFDDCSFMGAVEFQGTTFNFQGQASSRISFEEARFAQCPVFAEALFRGSAAKALQVSFRGVKFTEGANFSKASFGDVSDSGVMRAVDVSFAEVECKGTLNMTRGLFRGDFRGVSGQRIDGTVTLDEAVFSGVADFSDAKLLRPAGAALSAIGTRFEKDADFSEVHCEGDVTFEAAVFLGAASFETAIITTARGGSPVVKFQRASFEGLMNFDGLTCGEAHRPITMDFSFAFLGEKVEASFLGARFFGPVLFDYARLQPVVGFARVEFAGPVRFRDATVERRLSFSSVRLSGDVDFSNARIGDAVEFVGTVGSRMRVGGWAKFANARLEGGFTSRNVDWGGGMDFSQATISRKVVFEQSGLGVGWLRGSDVHAHRINFTRTRLAEGMQLDGVEIASELVMRRLPGTLTVELNEVSISGMLPDFDRIQLESPGEIDRLTWSPELEEVIEATVSGGTEEAKRDASRRLRILAEFADIARDAGNRDRLLAHAHDLAPQPLKGSALFRAGSALILGRRREDVGRAATILALMALLIFPLIYLATYKHVRDSTALSWSLSDLVQDCVQGSGSVGIAALYTSLRSTLFLIPESEDRSKHAAECLYGGKSELLSTSWIALLPIVQAGLSGILLFAIGFAVKKRLAYR